MKKEELLIGKTIIETREILRNSNYRIVMKNLLPFMITQDYKIDRYNLYLDKNDIVINVTLG